jgi:tRNA wybutosine-synthesizing protein 4
VADEFLRCYTTQKAPRRSPLINRGYYIRLKLIRSIIAQFVSLLKGQQVQVVSLGAGFDTSFWALKSSNCFCETSVRWLETDFGDVVSRKAAIIRSEKLLRNLIEEVGHDGDASILCRFTLFRGPERRNSLPRLHARQRRLERSLGLVREI